MSPWSPTPLRSAAVPDMFVFNCESAKRRTWGLDQVLNSGSGTPFLVPLELLFNLSDPEVSSLRSKNSVSFLF